MTPSHASTMKTWSTVWKIVDAIVIKEGGYTPGTVPFRLNNPMDLIYAKQAGASAHTITGADSKQRTYAQFASWEAGLIAGFRQVLARLATGHTVIGGIVLPMTLRILITDEAIGWAPASDGNNSDAYLKFVCDRSGVGADDPLPKLFALSNITKG